MKYNQTQRKALGEHLGLGSILIGILAAAAFWVAMGAAVALGNLAPIGMATALIVIATFVMTSPAALGGLAIWCGGIAFTIAWFMLAESIIEGAMSFAPWIVGILAVMAPIVTLIAFFGGRFLLSREVMG